MNSDSRRFFFRDLTGSVLRKASRTWQEKAKIERDLAGIVEEITGSRDELADFDRGFFDSYEMSYSMTLAYPREFFEQMAEKAAIEHRGVETLDLVRALHQRGVI